MDITAVLATMQRGEILCDADRKFRELLAAILETGKKGKLTLSIEVKPSKFAMGGGVLEVGATYKCSIDKPELGMGESLFFVTQSGDLSADHPNQIAMFEEEKHVERT
jgi:hypothetical protein